MRSNVLSGERWEGAGIERKVSFLNPPPQKKKKKKRRKKNFSHQRSAQHIFKVHINTFVCVQGTDRTKSQSVEHSCTSAKMLQQQVEHARRETSDKLRVFVSNISSLPSVEAAIYEIRVFVSRTSLMLEHSARYSFCFVVHVRWTACQSTKIWRCILIKNHQNNLLYWNEIFKILIPRICWLYGDCLVNTTLNMLISPINGVKGNLSIFLVKWLL